MIESARTASSALRFTVANARVVAGDEPWSSHVTTVPNLAHARRNRFDRSVTFCSRSGDVSSRAASESLSQPIHDRL
eukprot:3071990-Rhodomonas_salina.1